MNQISFVVQIVVVGVVVLAILLGALVFSGILDLRNNSVSRLFTGRSDISHLLDKKVTFSHDISEEVQDITLQNIEKAREAIRANPEHPEGWLDLAIFYKLAGDMDSALKIWKYFSDEKNDLLSTQNLANAYHLDLKEYEKSEKYYKKALGLEPRMANIYIGLHELYRYSYKQDTSLAIDILQEGLSNVDKDGKARIYIALALYYHEKGENELALSAYQDARAIAVELKNTSLVRQIDEGLKFLLNQ